MSEEKKNESVSTESEKSTASEKSTESAETTKSTEKTGSSELIEKKGPSANSPGTEGEPKATAETSVVDADKYVPRETYEKLEQKLGEQGIEVGDFRKFFNEVSPLLDKLQKQPEIVEAIMEGKIDTNLAKAVFEGRVKIEDATNVASAHEEVKKEIGDKKYSQSSPAEIEKMVEEKISAVKTSLESGIKSSEEKRKYQDGVNDFIKETSDFPEYADKIVAYIEEHPEIFDIKIAYDAVKGRTLIDQQEKDAKEKTAEDAKALASNAAGGASQGGKIIENPDVIDDLISGKTNPNVF